MELTVVVHVLKVWLHYLLGKKFLLLTDNTCVKNRFMQLGLNARRERSMFFLHKFDFDVRHSKGKENKAADALSRRTHKVYELIMSHPKSDLLDKVKTSSTQDVEYTKLLGEIQSNEAKLNGTYFKFDRKGLIWFKYRLYMPKNLEIIFFILNEMHKPPFASHPSYHKMITALRKKFF